MNNHPEYTDREKEMRVSEMKAVATLEAVQQILTDAQHNFSSSQEQLNDAQQMINDAQSQLNDVQLELIRNTHNIGAVVGQVSNAIAELMKGGDGE